MGLEYILITVLIFSGWGGLFGWSHAYHKADCLERNALLDTESREGPRQSCA